MSIIYCLVKCHIVVITNLLIYSYMYSKQCILNFSKENKKPDIQCCVVVTFFTPIKALKDKYIQ